ncbi:hypothetical protein FFWV33_12460 [Flavobacterium faecale]|uniref:PrcB C-terminal domain-containing protein n=1 Tax=Flavobacterium faecale TaxID=1355330 RepID=A0A2S1LEV0_9FLAO|nr:protease complex subunit PrcB family protein [Flavobacterium faecale]AWG22273.1 hypothetical protein FFWV33_12460 [Flavobacterium faecale]
MKKLGSVLLAAFVVSCGTTAVTTAKKQPLYQLLTQQPTGGASIKFYEILSEANEIKMLQNDPVLRKKISPNDLQNANFLILNMGEKPTAGYGVVVEEVMQTQDSIVVTVKESVPAEGTMVTQNITYPYAVLKINSKKPIRIK